MLKLPAGTSTTLVALVRAKDAPRARREADSGLLVPVMRGVYAPAAEWAELAPWERYAARVQASGMQHPDAARCLESAAVAHELPIFGDPVTVHLLEDSHSRSRTLRGIELHTTQESRAIVEIDGIAVTSLAETVVDLARSRHHAVGLAVADAALRRDASLTVEQLVATNEARASSRGRKHARWVLHRATASAESPLESVDRAVIEWKGFPDPELQVWIGSDRVDKWWEAYGVAGEGDGDLKYDGRFGDARDAMRMRHERDARLFDNGARAVPHWGWPEAIAADPLGAMLLSAGVPIITPPDAAELLSLRRLLGRRS